MSDHQPDEAEAPDPEPDEGDLEAGADFTGDYPDPNPANVDTAEP